MDMKKEIVGTKTAVFCSLCAVGVAPLALPAAAGASAQPAALQALEQKMSSLQVSSERVDAAVSISARKLPRKLRALRGLSVVDSVEASTTPPGRAASAAFSRRLVNTPLIKSGSATARGCSGARRNWYATSG